MELWWRNPIGYLQFISKKNLRQIIWNEQMLTRNRVDPNRVMEMHLPSGVDWRALVIRPHAVSAYEVRPGHTSRNPYAEYPVWSYGDSDKELDDLVRAARDTAEPRIIVANIPKFSPLFWPFFQWLTDVQDDNRDVIFHIHGFMGFNPTFGIDWRSVDFDPAPSARKGNYYLPCGREMIGSTHDRHRAEARDDAIWHKWAGLVGHTAGNKVDYDDRIDCTIESAFWAQRHYREQYRVDFRRRNRLRSELENHPALEGQMQSPLVGKPIEAMVGDKLLCDQCSLASQCRYYREGAVCSLPGSEVEKLTTHFKTRDSSVIIGGLQELMQLQGERLKVGMEEEEARGAVLANTSRVWRDMFDAGVKLAKLLDPKLNGMNGGGNVINVGTIEFSTAPASERAAKAMEALELMGVPREMITNDMVEAVLEGKQVPITPAIEAHLAKRDG